MAAIQGNWQVSAGLPKFVYADQPNGDRLLVAKVGAGDDRDYVGTALLIAAAPELLRTCRSLLGMLGDVYEDDLYRHGSPSEDAWPSMLVAARAVIAKAEGRSE